MVKTIREIAAELGVTTTTIAFAARDGKEVEGYRFEYSGDDRRNLTMISTSAEDAPPSQTPPVSSESVTPSDDEAGGHLSGETEQDDDQPTEDEEEVEQSVSPDVASDIESAETKAAEEPGEEAGDTAPPVPVLVTDLTPLEEAPIHGRTTNALQGAGMLYVGDVVRYLGDVPHIDSAVAALTKLKGVGEKGARELMEWVVAGGAWSQQGSVEGEPERSETPPNKGNSGHVNADLETGVTAGETAPLTFGALHVGDEFDYPTRHGIQSFRKEEAGRHIPDGKGSSVPFNAVYLTGEFAGKKTFFTADTEIIFDAVAELEEAEVIPNCVDCGAPAQTQWEDGADVCSGCSISRDASYFSEIASDEVASLAEEPKAQLKSGRELAAAFNAWLAERYPSNTTSRGDLAKYDDDVLMEVRKLLGGSYSFDQLARLRRGEKMAASFELAVRRLVAGDEATTLEEPTDDPIDFTFDDVQGTGEVKTWTAPDTVARPTEPEPEPVERNAVDGELVHVEFELDRAAAYEARSEGDTTEVAQDATTVAQEQEPAPVEFSIVPREERVHPMLPCCRVIGKATDRTDDWHALRARGIGSSDAGAIMGLNPHATIVDVWMEKRGEETERKPWLDDYSEFGAWFESHLLRWLEEEQGVRSIAGNKLGTLQSATIPWMLANVDAFDIGNGELDELKTCESKWKELPAHYESQVQHQMAVTGALVCRIRQFICPIARPHAISIRDMMREAEREHHEFFFADEADAIADERWANWLLRNGELVNHIVERDESYIAKLIDREREFWESVQSGTEPMLPDNEGEVDLSDDRELAAAIEPWAAARGSGWKSAEKLDKKLAQAARGVIKKVTALLGITPKRIRVGKHTLTYVQKQTHSYWNLYVGETDVEI